MKLKRGFSLVELLVVVLIISVLMSIALPGYEKAGQKAHFVQVQSYMDYWMKSLEAYAIANGYISIEDLSGVAEIPAGWSCQKSQWSGWRCPGTKVGQWNIFSGRTYAVSWYPDSSKFDGAESDYVLSKEMGKPWKWIVQDRAPKKEKITTKIMCEWWVKTAGRPTDNTIAALCD